MCPSSFPSVGLFISLQPLSVLRPVPFCSIARGRRTQPTAILRLTTCSEKKERKEGRRVARGHQKLDFRVHWPRSLDRSSSPKEIRNMATLIKAVLPDSASLRPSFSDSGTLWRRWRRRHCRGHPPTGRSAT